MKIKKYIAVLLCSILFLGMMPMALAEETPRTPMVNTSNTTALEILTYAIRDAEYPLSKLFPDGVNWTSIAKGLQNSGTTTDFEYYDLGSYSASHIKFTGYGYNAGTWNNFNEICFYSDAAQYECDKAVRDARFAKKGADFLLKVGETKPLDFYIAADYPNAKLTFDCSDNLKINLENMTVTALDGGNAWIFIRYDAQNASINTTQYTKTFDILIEE